MDKLSNFWIIILISGICGISHGNTPNVITLSPGIADSLNIQDKVNFFVDAADTVHLGDVSALKFTSLQSLEMEAGYSYWATFAIADSSEINGLLLYCGEFDHIQLFGDDLTSANMIKRGWLTSIQYRRDASGLLLNQLYLPLDSVKSESGRYYVRLKNELRDFRNIISFSLQTLPFAKTSTDRWMAERSGYDVFFGLFMGCILIFTFYSTFQYVNSREKAYLFYIAYLLGLLFYYLRIFEAGTQFNILFAHFMEWYYYFEAPIPLLTIIVYIYFLIYFLDLPSQKNKSLYNLFRYSAWCVLAYIFIDFLIKSAWGLETAFSIYFFSRLFGVLVGLYAVVQILKLRSWLSGVVIIGSAVLLVGGGLAIILYMRAGESVKVFNDLVLNRSSSFWKIPMAPMQLGILIEVIIFQMALGYKTKSLLDERNEHQRNWAASELKALKAQLNPHFIFNSLNSIKNLIIRQENDSAEEYLEQFSTLLRKILEYSNQSSVSLKQELELCNLYVKIEKLRHENAFAYEVYISPEIDQGDTMVPPLIFQPYLENAIWHGLLHKETGSCKLSLNIKLNGNLLDCEVEDNGIGREASMKSQPGNRKSMGMSIAAERLRILGNLNQQIIGVKIIDKKDKFGNASGTLVKLLIPQN